MEIYRDKVLQVEGEDYTLVDNVVIFKKPFDLQPEYVEKEGMYYPVRYEGTDCGKIAILGNPVKWLPPNAVIIESGDTTGDK